MKKIGSKVLLMMVQYSSDTYTESPSQEPPYLLQHYVKSEESG